MDANAATPSRLTVYDAPLDLESITPQMRENLDDELTEVKSENAIDRITSQANPRTLERVPAGARFKIRLAASTSFATRTQLVGRLAKVCACSKTTRLGGGGSRGSGRIRFAN